MLLECYILGTSGSLPLPNRSLTSVMIRREGEGFLFDCGEGLQISLRRMHIKWKNFKVICISHSHADHVTGLPGILMLSSQADREFPLTIICPRSVKQFIEHTREHLGMYIKYEIQYIILEDHTDGKIFEDDDRSYNISAYRGDHTRDVWYFIFEEELRPGKFYPEKATSLGIPMGKYWSALQRGEEIEYNGTIYTPKDVMGKNRKGRKISYVTDTRPTKGIQKHIANSDLVFCEATFKHQHLEQAMEKKHMTSVEAATLIRDAGGITQAGLIHFSPRYTYQEILELEHEAKKISDNVYVCQEREKIEIPFVR